MESDTDQRHINNITDVCLFVVVLCGKGIYM